MASLANMIKDAVTAAKEAQKQEVLRRVLPDCYIYISHLDEGIQYWQLPAYPEEITDHLDSSFQTNTALGRSAPVYTYSHSGPRSISVSLKFHRDMFYDMPRNTVLKEDEDPADNFIHALQAIAVPKYNLSNKAIEPPLVAVRLGSEVFIKGIVSGGVRVTYSKPILTNEKYAGIQIDFTISEVDPYDSTTIYKNGSFRGLTQTLRSGMHF